MTDETPGATSRTVDEEITDAPPSPRRRPQLLRLIVNVVAVIAAIIVVVSLVIALNASAAPSTDAELMAAARLTTEDVARTVITLDEQRAILEDAGGSVREQATSSMVLSGVAANPESCDEVTEPRLPDGAVWSSRAVWVDANPGLEIALLNGADVLPTSAEAAEEFALLDALTQGCAAAVKVDRTTEDPRIPRLSVRYIGEGTSTRVQYTLLGNVIFVSGVMWAGSGSATATAGILNEANSRQSERIDDVGAELFDALVSDAKE